MDITIEEHVGSLPGIEMSGVADKRDRRA